MKFSFIIAMYNEEKDIGDTINACISQKYSQESFEVILVDDGSEDKGFEKCIANFGNLKNIKMFHYDTNKGVAYARNYGVDNSRGSILIFLNADEIIPNDFLLKIERHYNSGADYVYPQTRVINTQKAYGLFRDCYRLYKYNRPYKFLWSQGFSCTRDSFKQVNGFDTRYPKCGGEDWDLTTRIDRLALKKVVDLDIVVRHKVPDNFSGILWHIR